MLFAKLLLFFLLFSWTDGENIQEEYTVRGQVCTSVRQDAVDDVLQGLPLRRAAESFNIPKDTWR